MRVPRLTNRAVAVAACSLIAAGSLLTPAAATILPLAAQAAAAHKASETPTFSVPGGTYGAPVKLKLGAGRAKRSAIRPTAPFPPRQARPPGPVPS